MAFKADYKPTRKTRNLDFWTKFNDPRVQDLVEATEEYVDATKQEIVDLKARIEELELMLGQTEEDNAQLRDANRQALALLATVFVVFPEWHEIKGAVEVLKKAL